MLSRSKRSSQSRKNYYLPKQQLEELLKNIGVILAGDTSSDLIAYCPFHHNRDSPAFNISLVGPHLWKCHNGKCAKQGNIFTLLTMKGYSRSEAEKMLMRGVVEVDDLLAVVNDILGIGNKKRDAKREWHDVDPLQFALSDERNGFPAREYMRDRGITDEAVDFFKIGYSKKKDMAVIPVLDEAKNLIGIIGREIKTKRYQYSTGLSRGDIIWNISNAKHFDSIILCEGSLDAVYLWQAGYQNVGAVLGSAISPNQWKQLRKYFTEIVCFFDNDDAGQGLTYSIIESVKDISVSYVEYPDRMIEWVDGDGEPQQRPIKDPGELTSEEIKHMIDNRKSSLNLLLEAGV